MTPDIVQGQCLMSSAGEGSQYMGGFDCFPAPVRERVRQSRWNLCAACLSDIQIKSKAAGLEERLLWAVDMFESQLEATEA